MIAHFWGRTLSQPWARLCTQPGAEREFQCRASFAGWPLSPSVGLIAHITREASGWQKLLKPPLIGIIRVADGD